VFKVIDYILEMALEGISPATTSRPTLKTIQSLWGGYRGLFVRRESGGSMKLNTHIHLVSS